MAKTIIEVAKEILERKKEALNPIKMYHIANEMGLTKELNLNGKRRGRVLLLEFIWI